MNKLINNVINNKYIIFIAIIVILLFIQMQNVNMYADDYFIIISFQHMEKTLENICQIIINAIVNNYKLWSGRLLGHAIVSLILIFNNISIYQIINPIIILIFAYVISKIINIKKIYKTEQILFWVLVIIVRFRYMPFK